MSKFSKVAASLALCALVLFGGPAAAAILMIDDFQNPVVGPPTFTHWLEQYIVGFGDNYPPNPGADTSLPLASTIGGERAYQLIYEGGGVNGAAAAMKIIGSPNQDVSFSDEQGVAAEFQLSYGNMTYLSANFSGIDAIQISFLPPDHDSQFIVQLLSNMESVTVGESVVYSLPAGYTGLFSVPLTDFPSIDLADVDFIGFAFGFDPSTNPINQEPTYVANLQMGIDFIQAVGADIPEPASLTLLGLGALALARRRRRRS